MAAGVDMVALLVCCLLAQGTGSAYKQGLDAYSRDDLPAAEAFLKRARQAGGASFELHYLLGATLVRMDRGVEAIPELEAAHKLRPRQVDVVKLLAIQYMNAGPESDALHLLQKVPAMDRDEELYLLLIEANQDAGSVDETARLVARAAGRFPKSARVNAWMGFEMREAGRFAEAQTFLRQALQEDPDLPAPYFLLGDVLLKSEKYREALPWLRKAIEMAPKDGEAKIALSRTLAGLGEPRQALLGLEGAFQELPEDARIALELARLYARQGQTEKARAQAEVAAGLRSRERTVPESLLLGKAKD